MSKDNVRYMHVDIGKGKATAAIEEKTGAARVGLAFCSPKDQFNKKIGRLISSGRLQHDKCFFELTLDPERRLKEQVYEAFKAALSERDERFPDWAR